MNIEKLIKELTKDIAKTVLNKKEETTQRVALDQGDSIDPFQIILKRFIYDGNYNKAEDILFEEINKNPSQEVYQTALNFYNSLLEKSDEELQQGNFTRDEIYQGLQDLKTCVESNPDTHL